METENSIWPSHRTAKRRECGELQSEYSAPRRFQWEHRPPLAACGPAMGVLLLVLLLSAGEKKSGYLAVRLAIVFLGIGIVSGAASCGGGSGGGGNGGGGVVTPATPTGTYNLTVTATSGSGTRAIQHSVALTLTVN